MHDIKNNLQFTKKLTKPERERQRDRKREEEKKKKRKEKEKVSKKLSKIQTNKNVFFIYFFVFDPKPFIFEFWNQ